VPPSARTKVPTRTLDQLLTEARSATADWKDAELTADRIREAVRTSSANGRLLREALKAERAESADRPALHAVPDPDPDTTTATADSADAAEGEEKAS